MTQAAIEAGVISEAVPWETVANFPDRVRRLEIPRLTSTAEPNEVFAEGVGAGRRRRIDEPHETDVDVTMSDLGDTQEDADSEPDSDD